ncbi:MAG: beta-lactamase family protein [Kiritimatiellae bacterium]|nr:beta-lactamase family protein [Kiritimatiellia bacterium]
MEKLLSLLAAAIFAAAYLPAVEVKCSGCASNQAIGECERIFKAEIRDGVVHGAAVIAGGLDGAVQSGSWGWADCAHTVPMTTRTVIDMASVTKVAAGITAYLVAHAKGNVDFDAAFTDCLPSYTAAIGHKVTIRDLANHVSGFGEADGNPRVYFSTNATTMMRNILSMPPNVPHENKVFYSCRNYVLLGRIFEDLTGRSVKDFCRREIFDVVGMNDTSLGAPRLGIERNRLAQTMGTDEAGVISDYVARPLWAADIGTFNAGMFSSAEDMAKLMRVYLRGGVTDDGKRIFGEKEIREIVPSQRKRIQGARKFGWQFYDENLPEFLFGSSLFHSGWSGQTALVDFKRKRYAIVVTTRCGDYDRAKRERFAAIAALMK